jgi:hypothetical protein
MKKFQSEIDKRDNAMAAMQKAIDDQAAIIKQLQADSAAAAAAKTPPNRR